MLITQPSQTNCTQRRITVLTHKDVTVVTYTLVKLQLLNKFTFQPVLLVVGLCCVASLLASDREDVTIPLVAATIVGYFTITFTFK